MFRSVVCKIKKDIKEKRDEILIIKHLGSLNSLVKRVWGPMKKDKYSYLFDKKMFHEPDDIDELRKHILLFSNGYSPINFTIVDKTVTREEMTKLFKRCEDEKLFLLIKYLFIYFALTKKYTHLVLCNGKILDIVFSKFLCEEKSKEYCALFYGFYLLYLEEISIDKNLTDDMRCVIDLDDARYLPSYTLSLWKNPYVPLNIEKKYYTSDFYKDKVICPLYLDGWGLYSHDVALERFNKFTYGMFKGLDMTNINFCGSVIPACCIKNPIEDSSYFSKYYGSSDIDVIANVESNEDLDKIALRIVKCILNNGGKDIKYEKEEINGIYKYKINAARNIEIFRTFLPPAGSVSGFHFPVVKGYFNGRFKLLPSFISTAMTGIMCHMGKMKDIESAAKLIIKYYERGFRMILNEKEHKYMNIFMGMDMDYELRDEKGNILMPM